MMHETACGIIAQGRGSHFDPDIVDAFLDIQQEFHQIATRFGDESNAPTPETGHEKNSDCR
jgi:putative two-component system response regulator